MGLDPGVKGGYAVLGAVGNVVYLRGFTGRQTEEEMVAAFVMGAEVLRTAGGNICFVEKVHYQRGDGGKGAFTFGGVYRLARGVLLTKGVHLLSVPPILWQSRLQCLTGGDKKISKRRAVQLFSLFLNGDKKITHATADALLIAEYGRQRLFTPRGALVAVPRARPE